MRNRILLLAGTVQCGHASDATLLGEIERNLPEVEKAAGHLASLAPQAQWSVFAIAALGILGTTMAKFEKPVARWTGAAAGLLVAVLTLVNSTFYVLDHKTMRFIAQDALDLVPSVRQNIENYRAVQAGVHGADRDQASEPYLRAVADRQFLLNRLETQAREGGHTIGFKRSISYIRPVGSGSAVVSGKRDSWFELESVHAMDGPPSWVKNPPFDKNRTGYVGVAACSTAFGAREMARYQAMEVASRRLNPKAADLDSTIAYVERNAINAANYFVYEPSSRLYWHHTLLYLDNAKSTPAAMSKWTIATDPKVRWTDSARIAGTGLVRVGGPTAPRGSANEGRFAFTLQPGNTLALTRIETFDDSSVGSTRWIFKVFIDNRLALHVPVHRYDDSGKPTACLIRTEDQRIVSIPARAGSTIRVDGFKPKDY